MYCLGSDVMDLMNFPKDKMLNAVKNSEITICVIGLGRVGLPTAAIFAESGARVIGVDIDLTL